MAVKDTAASVLVKLKNQSKATGLNYQMCLQLFCQEEFLRRVAVSRFTQNLVLKGGMFIYALTEFTGRPTHDIDFLLRWFSNDVTNVRNMMEEICAVETGNNFIALEVLSTEVITEEKEYHGVKTKFRAYIKNVRVPFSIDVGVDDIIIPGAVKRRICTRLDGFLPPEIYTYSVESTIAEKFDAILKRMEATSRMKDFYDIYYLSGMLDFDGRKMQEAIRRTLEHRGTFYETESIKRILQFKENTFLLNLWNNYKENNQMDCPEFDIIINRLYDFLSPVFLSILHEEEFFLFWSSKTLIWNSLQNTDGHNSVNYNIA